MTINLNAIYYIKISVHNNKKWILHDTMQNIMQLSEKFIYSIMQTESWVTDDGKKKSK